MIKITHEGKSNVDKVESRQVRLTDKVVDGSNCIVFTNPVVTTKL